MTNIFELITGGKRKFLLRAEKGESAEKKALSQYYERTREPRSLVYNIWIEIARYFILRKKGFISVVRPRLHEQIKHKLFAQIRPELLHGD